MSSPPLRGGGKGVGLVLSHEQFRTDQLVAQARAAEEAGFQYVWASDHIQPWQDNEGHSMFPWLTLALWATTPAAFLWHRRDLPEYRYHPATVAQASPRWRSSIRDGCFGPRHWRAAQSRPPPTRSVDTPSATTGWSRAIGLIRQLWSGSRISFAGLIFRRTP